MSHGYLPDPGGAITPFDAPGAGTGPGRGTLMTSVVGLYPAGAITGWFIHSSNVLPGFVRDKNGGLSTFDASGVGTGRVRARRPDVNPAGAIMGNYLDARNVWHEFLRFPPEGE